MKTVIIFGLCVIVSVGIAAKNKVQVKKEIILGKIKIESAPTAKSIKRELEQFKLETVELKKHLTKLQKTIKSHSIYTNNNVKVKERF